MIKLQVEYGLELNRMVKLWRFNCLVTIIRKATILGRFKILISAMPR